MMTLQDIFDRVRTHLLAQNRRSEARSRSRPDMITCKYRDRDGSSCAIGCLIPDHLYSSDLEDFGIYSVEPNLRVVLAQAGINLDPDEGGPYEKTASLLTELRKVHDYRPVREWDNYLRQVAAAFELQVTG